MTNSEFVFLYRPTLQSVSSSRIQVQKNASVATEKGREDKKESEDPPGITSQIRNEQSFGQGRGGKTRSTPVQTSLSFFVKTPVMQSNGWLVFRLICLSLASLAAFSIAILPIKIIIIDESGVNISIYIIYLLNVLTLPWVQVQHT